MSFFEPVTNWVIPRAAWEASFREMAIDGFNGNEGVAFWLGNRDGGIASVSHVVILRGAELVKRPDLLVIPEALVNDVTDVAIEHDVALVGQIHSHGRLYGTNLSATDRTYGIKVPYFLSLVAPDYAQRPQTELVDCGVHVYELRRGFRRLAAGEIGERLQLSSGNTIPVLTVGEG